MTGMRGDETFMAHCLLYEFDQGSSSGQAYRKVKKLYGNSTVKESTCERYFKQFQSGDFSFQDIFFSDSEEEEQYFVPAKKLRVHNESAAEALRIPLDALVDILKFLPRQSLTILEESNSLLYETCRKHIATVHVIKASLHIRTPFSAILSYRIEAPDFGSWDSKEITDLFEVSDPKFVCFASVGITQTFDDELLEYWRQDHVPNKNLFKKLKKTLTGAKVSWTFSRLMQQTDFDMMAKYLVNCNSITFDMSPHGADDSHCDVYIKNGELIEKTKCGYNAKTILKLLEGNLQKLYINKVDDFNGCEIDLLIDECKKNFENAEQPKKYSLTIRAEDCPDYYMSYKPPAEFHCFNHVTDEELKLTVENQGAYELKLERKLI